METISLTVPYVPDSRKANQFTINRLDLNWGAQSIVIELYDSTSGTTLVVAYDGEVAVNLMKILNKTDLSVKSLHKRILEKLVADGHVSGAIIGNPD